MSFIVYIFPIAVLVFVFLLAAQWLPLLRGGAEEGARLSFSVPQYRMVKKDRLLVLCITAVYALVAFINLGDTKAPQSFCQFTERGSYVDITLPEGTQISRVQYYSGLHTGTYYVQVSEDGEIWADSGTFEQNYVAILKWNEAELNLDPTNHLRIISDSPLNLGELALYGADGQRLDPQSFTYLPGGATLFDEQELVPAMQTFMNSSYFDEIYHARTALEHLEDVKPYEISHPPLGKIIIGIGISLFGMTPFGWRFSGALFGALMLPCLYYFLKKMFGRTDIAACGTAIFAFDFMHFAQTRIATIDTYAVFFIILMYLFMWLYVARGDRRALAASGLFFGLGAASKWTCIYAGGGLAVLWLLSWISRRGEEKLGRKFIENCLFCVVFFVLVPLAVYYISYAPYGRANGLDMPAAFFSREYFDIVWGNQKYMFNYHSGLVSTHPYSSRWYQWIVDGRPILYYLNYGEGTRTTIGAFLSPLLCWSGLLAMIGTGVLALRKKSGTALFILVGYLAQLLPWVAVSRLTFEYHYFPSAVFLLLAVCLMFSESFKRDGEGTRKWLYAFTGVSLVLFALFYPVLAGAEVPEWYGQNFLRWIPGAWPF